MFWVMGINVEEMFWVMDRGNVFGDVLGDVLGDGGREGRYCFG